MTFKKIQNQTNKKIISNEISESANGFPFVVGKMRIKRHKLKTLTKFFENIAISLPFFSIIKSAMWIF